MPRYAPLSNAPDRSRVSGVIREIKLLLYDQPDIKVVKISCKGNEMAHAMADLRRRGVCSGVMQGAVLACVLALTWHDCNANYVS